MKMDNLFYFKIVSSYARVLMFMRKVREALLTSVRCNLSVRF